MEDAGWCEVFSRLSWPPRESGLVFLRIRREVLGDLGAAFRGLVTNLSGKRRFLASPLRRKLAENARTWPHSRELIEKLLQPRFLEGPWRACFREFARISLSAQHLFRPLQGGLGLLRSSPSACDGGYLD